MAREVPKIPFKLLQLFDGRIRLVKIGIGGSKQHNLSREVQQRGQLLLLDLGYVVVDFVSFVVD